MKDLHLTYTSPNTFEVRELETESVLGHIRYGLTADGQPDAYVFTPLDGDPKPGAITIANALRQSYGEDIQLLFSPILL